MCITNGNLGIENWGTTFKVAFIKAIWNNGNPERDPVVIFMVVVLKGSCIVAEAKDMVRLNLDIANTLFLMDTDDSFTFVSVKAHEDTERWTIFWEVTQGKTIVSSEIWNAVYAGFVLIHDFLISVNACMGKPAGSVPASEKPTVSWVLSTMVVVNVKVKLAGKEREETKRHVLEVLQVPVRVQEQKGIRKRSFKFLIRKFRTVWNKEI